MIEFFRAVAREWPHADKADKEWIVWGAFILAIFVTLDAALLLL